MTDVFDTEKRSAIMARVKGKHTRPERLVRTLLHRLGFRFTVNGPKNKTLPGKPDLVLPRYRTVVFVHGCFWHGHENCRHHRIPKTRSEWWRSKIEGNRLRDQRNLDALRADGWNTVVLWTCEFDTAFKKRELIARLPKLIAPEATEFLSLVAETKGLYGTKKTRRAAGAKKTSRQKRTSET